MKRVLLTGMAGTGKSAVERLATRTSNTFGKRPEELARVLDDLEHTEPKLRRVAGHEIDTTAPLDEVVAAVLQIVS